MTFDVVLHLLNDDFDGCHNLAQTQEEDPYSCNLHAVVHRREPDYWNSKYVSPDLDLTDNHVMFLLAGTGLLVPPIAT